MNASDTASEHHCPSCGSGLIHTEVEPGRHECHSCGKAWPAIEFDMPDHLWPASEIEIPDHPHTGFVYDRWGVVAKYIIDRIDALGVHCRRAPVDEYGHKECYSWDEFARAIRNNVIRIYGFTNEEMGIEEPETQPLEIYPNESLESAVIRLANFKKQRDSDNLLDAHRAIARAAGRQMLSIKQDRADNG